MYKAVLFDLDGTLIDSAPLIVESVRQAFDDFELPVPTPETVTGHIGIPIEIYFPEIAGPGFSALNPADVFVRFRSYFREGVDKGLLRTFPGVPQMLEALKREGVLTGIATSKTTEPARHSCEKTGILKDLDVIVGSDMVAAYKPAPDTVYKCLELLGLPDADSVLVVGDTEGDIVMGTGAGANTCGVTWGAHSAERLMARQPDSIVASIEELRTVIGV